MGPKYQEKSFCRPIKTKRVKKTNKKIIPVKEEKYGYCFRLYRNIYIYNQANVAKMQKTTQDVGDTQQMAKLFLCLLYFDPR